MVVIFCSRPPFSFITQEVVEATCQCLLAQAEEAERLCKTSTETEGLVLEEFGRCLLQIIEYASKAKGTIKIAVNVQKIQAFRKQLTLYILSLSLCQPLMKRRQPGQQSNRDGQPSHGFHF
jgi:hypothetical protein